AGNVPPEVTAVVNDPNTDITEEEALEDYFIQRTRRVPFVEAVDITATTQDDGTNNMRPKDEWIYPANPATGASNNGLTLRQQQPPATDPADLEGDELLLGDRMTVGNGLPAEWWEPDLAKFVNFYDQQPQFVGGSDTPNAFTWNGSTEPRTRMTQVIPLDDIGDTSRGGFWERSAAEAPTQPLDGIGGLRVITGAGIYDPSIPLPATPPLSLNNTSFLSDPNTGARQVTEQTPNALPFTLGLGKPIFDVRDDLSTFEDESLQDDPRTAPVEGFTVVFPDSMPMWEDYDDAGTPNRFPSPATDRRGDLLMRASAVYHYRSGSNDPIACVSSYYDPSNSQTAENRATLQDGTASPWQPPGVAATPTGNGLSNNGISYPASTTLSSTILSVTPTNGIFNVPVPDAPSGTGTLAQKLNYQANLIFPNGRLVNESLRKALIKAPADRNRADEAAIDSTICALEIADGSLAPNNIVVPHGAIYETTFLDARQVKAIESEPLYDPATNVPNTITSDYDLSLAERQPLEIRATVLDIDQLRQTAYAGTLTTVPAPEHLLPDSGIIYATRDDAILDLSAPGANPAPTAAPIDQAEADTRKANQKLNSPVDFVVDPHRRPNGIMLTNGAILARKDNLNQYKQEERGLILATNLPAYIKAAENPLAAGTFGFNLHQDTGGNLLEEFTDQLAGRDWTAAEFYNRLENERDTNFACRDGTPGLDCDPGDLWRSATVISDAVTLLSDNFRFGFRNEGDYDLRKNADNLTNNLAFQGYDLDGDGNIDNATPLDIRETSVSLDFNGDGAIDNEFILVDDDNNPGTILVKPTEAQIPLVVARRLNGFFDNNYLQSANWFDALGFPKDFDAAAGIQGSSYVNNLVTPIQRRAAFPQYAMEMCLKPLVELCGPDDWVAGYDLDENGVLTNAELNDKASDLISATPATNRRDLWGAGTTGKLDPTDPTDREFPLPYDINNDGDGDDPGEEEALWHYPRRIAFLRDGDNLLQLDTNMPVPLGVDNNATLADKNDDFVREYPYSGGRPPNVPNALWYKTTDDTNVNPPTDIDYGNKRLFFTNQVANNLTQQPLLVPVMQLHAPEDTPTGKVEDILGGSGRDGTWMQNPAADTTFNLIMATGDNPARPLPVEQNGGMPNMPNFLENWARKPGGGKWTTNIAGSFIQFRRRAFATGPFLHVLGTNDVPKDNLNKDPLFGDYPQQYTGTESTDASPFYSAPNRAWGFDVGLLSQLPDLFSSLITTPSAGEPNEFYREVSRNDDWIQTLLCAQTFDTATSTATGNAVSPESRPGNCPPPPTP
ncbi:MAG: hypothetical protein F6K14_29910, partial [Symploca sp. SIO2C1]|nr:hypothetical protein [Symploca sp. SIO2C1]